jgi:hypothetical protein
VMVVGVIVGTYSSLYIAAPFALLWEQLFGAKGSKRRAAGGAAASGSSSRTAAGRRAG